ncbi:MAG: MFS transporter [Pseudomonadota bacterium]
MAEQARRLHHEKTVFDDWRSICVALYLALAGYAVLVGIPVISSAWVNLLGFTESQVGRVAGADLGGLSIGAVVASFLITRHNRRVLIIISGLFAMATNGLCMVFTDYETVLLLRLTSGFGAGVLTSVAIATLGATSKPARTFNILLFAFAFSQALELYALPKLSMNGIYGVFIASFAVGLLFVRWIPPRAVDSALNVDVDVLSDDDNDAHADRVEPIHAPAYVPWLVLAAITATYINIGAYWTYIELATVDTAATQEWVSGVLVWASLFSLAGCLTATVISNRYGLARPLLGTLIIHAMIVWMLVFGIDNLTVTISIFAFNYLWIFIDVYQMATIANVDHSGRFAALIPGAQGLGQIVGPNIAASLLAVNLGYNAVFVMCALASLTAMLIYLYMYLLLRKSIPALADAS